MAPVPLSADVEARARSFVERHAGFVSRVLWSQGVPRAAIDDAAQQVFVVALAKIETLRDERAFLYAVAARTAKATRRSEAKLLLTEDGDAERHLVETDAAPEQLLSDKRARELLDQIVSGMPEELRTVFVLYELESLTMAEIAEALTLAPGTVASRLRRAREQFRAAVRRIQARAGGDVT